MGEGRANYLCGCWGPWYSWLLWDMLYPGLPSEAIFPQLDGVVCTEHCRHMQGGTDPELETSLCTGQ